MSPIALSGMASGLDTESMIASLMSVERQPRTRLALKDTQAAARQTGLRDLASKLGAVRDAANALKSTTTWADVQKLTSSDVARVAVRSDAGAAPGTRLIEVSRLATTAQHAFTYAPSATPQTLTIGAWSLEVAAGSDQATVAAAINADEDAPVKAVVAGGKLVLTSATSGAAGDFSVGASPLLSEDEAYARSGVDASYTLDGAPRTSVSNVITDALLGVEVTLKATTSAPVSITVGDPGPDGDAIKAKVQAFVSAYNSAVDFIRAKVGEERVKDPTSNADAIKGIFNGDSLMTGVLSQMRSQIGDLSAYGISTGAASGTGSFSADAVAGKLKIDDTKLTAALASSGGGLRTALDGLGARLSDVVTPVAGARVTAALDGVAATRKQLADSMARTDVRLAGKEARLRAQFSAMESALAASQAAMAQLSGQLSALGR